MQINAVKFYKKYAEISHLLQLFLMTAYVENLKKISKSMESKRNILQLPTKYQEMFMNSEDHEIRALQDQVQNQIEEEEARVGLLTSKLVEFQNCKRIESLF